MIAPETQNAPGGGFSGGAAEGRPRGTAFRKSNRKRSERQVSLNSIPTSIYDGVTRMGAFVEVGSRSFHAFDATGELLGHFPTRRAALAAVSEAYCLRSH